MTIRGFLLFLLILWGKTAIAQNADSTNISIDLSIPEITLIENVLSHQIQSADTANKSQIQALNSLLEKLVNTKTNGQSSSNRALEQAYKDSQLELHQERNRDYSIMLALAILLLIIAAFTIIKAKKSEKALNDKNRFISEQQQKLQANNEQLMASEEEIRQHSEEVMAVNERLKIETAQTQEAMQVAQAAQRELVQSEKMASLGQLTAGVAHEINNPVNYISGGTQALHLIIEDLIHMLEAYVTLDQVSTEEERATILKEIQRITAEGGSVEELKEDAQAMIFDIADGVDRVTEIVRGLNNFSRGDADTKQTASIHDLIESVLVILHNKYKNRVEIVREFATDEPVMSCYPGPLSQVFMNIIGNAIDAIPEKGTVTINTRNEAEHVFISIKDTGQGIPQEVMGNIFNPFFTTKGVGKGTGLGLSIVHGIINKHNADIDVYSEVGVGTEFLIILPKKAI